VSITIAVGASAPSPSSSETMLRPLIPSSSCGMPSFEPGPSSRVSTGSASRTRKVVVVAANRTGRRMIVCESRTHMFRSSSSRRSAMRFGISRTRSSRAAVK
jgi:hypothetical protein